MKKLLIVIIVMLSGCMSAEKKSRVNSMNTSLLGNAQPTQEGEPFIITVSNFSKKDEQYEAQIASQKKANSICIQNGFKGAQWSNGNGFWTLSDRAKSGNHEYFCHGITKEKEEFENQIVLIDKAKELCTNIGYTPNTDSHRGCVVELMKVDSGGTNVTVKSTNYQDMIDRGICMTTGKCDITGQPIIKNQSTITNSTCRVTGTGVWKTIQCF